VADVLDKIPAGVRAVYGEKQEPELTVLRGVGPFPVALYRGATTLGAFDASEQLPQDAAVHRVNPERSQQQMQALERQHNLNIGAGARVGAAIAGDVTGNIVLGSVGDTVDTGGGAYAGRNLDMRGVIANIGSTLDNAVQRVGMMQDGDTVRRAELQQLIEQLSAELQYAPAAQATAASNVAEKTRQAVEQAAKPAPNKTLIRVTVEGLKKAAEDIGAALPAVLPIVMKIVETLGK
jgi:hypothetical protein